ncbi:MULTISPECIES: hypothetical protein [unclassified Microcoleus]|uniref:hypothetical protein n=1 Tax=unclassified Microcoleus TaxID=2642155 RepID=UPI002FCF6AA5
METRNPVPLRDREERIGSISMKAGKVEIGVLRLSCCGERGRRKKPEEVFLQI